MIDLGFTPPKNIDEARAIMGQTIETPIGAMVCSGAGSSGSEIMISFHSIEGHVAIMWSAVDGWKTADDMKAASWTKAWDKLSNKDRELVEIVFDDLQNIETHSRKKPATLVAIAKNVLHRKGILEHATCGRCGGSGQFSWNAKTGSTCFKCNGKKKVFQSSTNCLKAINKKAAA